MPRNKPYTDDCRHSRHIQASSTEPLPIEREDAREVLRQLGITSELILNEYLGILEMARDVYLRGRTVDLQAIIPSLGGQQATNADMAATLEPMMKLARRLDEDYRNLPPGLLSKMGVPLTSNSNRPKPKLGVVIHALYKALGSEYVKHKAGVKRGRKKTEGKAAINAASYIINFAKRHAAEASPKDSDDFICLSLDLMKIPHPDPADHRGKYAAFISKATIVENP